MASNPSTQPAFTGEILGGLTAMLVALPSSIAFGVLAYSALGPAYAGAGAMAGLFGAAALGLVAPAIGRTAGLVAAPCAPAAAVLAALMTELSTPHDGSAGLSAQAVLSLVALTALVAALLQVAYGVLRGGGLIKFIPYPVVAGYLSCVGLIIALAQLPKVLGTGSGLPLLHALLDPSQWRAESVIIGLVTIITMATAPRITQRAPAAVIGLAGGVVSYFVLAGFRPELMQLDGNTLVIGKLQASGSFVDSVSNRVRSLGDISLHDISLVMVHALTLSVLLSIDTLKTCVGLDAITRNRHNSNRELIGQGVANLASFFSGGMPGSGTMGPSLVNINSGGRTYRSGIMEGVFVILAVLFLSPLIAWVPISTLAGILLVIAWRMFDKHIFHLLRFKSSRTDFAVIAAVILTAVTTDLIAAAAVGIALTIFLFIRDQISSHVIRRKLSLVQTASKTRREDKERELLDRFGEEGLFCELQGHLFFGTTDQLFTHLEADLKQRRFILLDLRRAQSMDYTAAQLFKRMNAQLMERNGRLLFSGMPSGVTEQRNFEKYLKHLGIVNPQDGVLVFETLDSALEWMEDRILAAHGILEHEDKILKLTDMSIFSSFSPEVLKQLESCLRETDVKAGDTIFSAGDSGDELFFVMRGAVSFYLPLESGKRHHLDTASSGSVFGEIAFLDNTVRSADAVAKTDCKLSALSRTTFDRVFADKPEVLAKTYVSLALLLAVRLRQTDKQLQALEDR